MSEPMSSKEIDDAISSIHQLVSQDLRPQTRPKLSAVADVGRLLVLTPENRVVRSSAQNYSPALNGRPLSGPAAIADFDGTQDDSGGLPDKEPNAPDGGFSGAIDLQARLMDLDAASLMAARAFATEQSPQQGGAALAGGKLSDDGFADSGVADDALAHLAKPAMPAADPSDLWISEAELRTMVQGIFRDEMAGPMGERLTRNIRRLVRAEMGKILAAQELEQTNS